MAGVFLEPEISPLLATRIESLLELVEDEEDVREGLKALAEEEGTLTWEQYQQQRRERELRGELSG